MEENSSIPQGKMTPMHYGIGKEVCLGLVSYAGSEFVIRFLILAMLNRNYS